MVGPSGSPSGVRRRSSVRQPGDEIASATGADGYAADNAADGSAAAGVPLPVSFVLTAKEAHTVQAALSRLGVMHRPAPLRLRSNSSTNPPTPTPSYPNTPSTALPRGSSPFVPMTAITNSNGPSSSSSGAVADMDRGVDKSVTTPRFDVALANAFDDEILPLSSRTAIRSFVLAYAVHSAIYALLPGLLGRKSARETVRALFSSAATRVGTVFASFTFTYRTIHYLLTYLRLRLFASLPEATSIAPYDASHRRRLIARLARLTHGNGVVPFLSALTASPVLHLLPSQTASKPGAATFPRKTIALDLFTKGLYFNFGALRKRRSSIVSWIPDWCDTALLYAIGNGQLLWAFLFEPDCFPKSYGDFILARSSAYVPSRPADLPASIPWPSRRELVDHVANLSTPSKSSPPFPGFTSPALAALHPSGHPTTSYTAINPVLDWSPAHPAHSRLMCAILHPTEPSCRANYLRYWALEWQQSAKFVAAFTALFNVFKLRAWKRDPEGSLFRFVMSVAQGATVISGSIASAWALTCLFQHYLPRNFMPRSRFFLNGFLSSIFIFAVPVTRRAQLGLYVARLSLDSTWQILVKQRKTRPVRNGDVYLLTFGLAMLASLYESAPYVLSGYVRRILRIVVGPRVTGTSAALAGLPLNSKADGTLDNNTDAWPAHNTTSSVLDANALESRLRRRAQS